MVRDEKKDWIILLKGKETKEKALSYIKRNMHSFIKKWDINDLYDILIEIEDQSIVENIVGAIIQYREDYHVFLEKNQKEKKLSSEIETHMLNIIWENYSMLLCGKGEKIQDTVLYGIEEKQILRRIRSILSIENEKIWLAVLEALSFYPNILPYIKENAFFIIENIIYKERLFLFLKYMKENGYESVGIENEDAIIACLLETKVNKLKEENILLPMKILLHELLEKTNTSIEEIEWKGSGSYSAYYRIGNLGMKTGTSKVNKKIPYHPRFLRPFLRKEVRKNTYVEVYKNINAIVLEKNKTINRNGREIKIEEIVYEIYKEMRDEGIIWIDPKADNLGILLEDNDTRINGEKIYIEDETVGFQTKEKHQTLKKGDIVILDVDTAVYEEDFNIEDYEDIDLGPYKKMEERYQREKLQQNKR